MRFAREGSRRTFGSRGEEFRRVSSARTLPCGDRAVSPAVAVLAPGSEEVGPRLFRRVCEVGEAGTVRGRGGRRSVQKAEGEREVERRRRCDE